MVGLIELVNTICDFTNPDTFNSENDNMKVIKLQAATLDEN